MRKNFFDTYAKLFVKRTRNQSPWLCVVAYESPNFKLLPLLMITTHGYFRCIMFVTLLHCCSWIVKLYLFVTIVKSDIWLEYRKCKDFFSQGTSPCALFHSYLSSTRIIICLVLRFALGNNHSWPSFVYLECVVMGTRLSSMAMAVKYLWCSFR